MHTLRFPSAILLLLPAVLFVSGCSMFSQPLPKRKESTIASVGTGAILGGAVGASYSQERGRKGGGMIPDKWLVFLGGLLAAIVLSFAWSTVLTLLLGRSLNSMAPWAVYEFMLTYGFSGRSGRLLGISFLVAFASSGVLTATLFRTSKPGWYGDARWAKLSEIRAATLLDNTGLLLGKAGGQYLINNEPIHTIVAAPTRSGKGVGFVIPNLLNWSGSIVVLDIKKENYEITAGYRSQHQAVFMWAPMDERSHKYNPFDFISSHPAHRITDLQKLSTILAPHSGRGETMWVEEARSLFIGLTLLTLDNPKVPHTIGQVYRTLMSETDLYQVAKLALEQRTPPLDPICRQLLASFKNKADKERSGVKSSLTAALALWANPNIDAATSSSDFNLSNFRRQRTTVYVGVGQDQLLTLAPLLNLFFQQAVSELSKRLPGKDEPHQVLFLVDEFAMLGSMPTLATGLALLAGYKIRIMVVVQGLGQLEEIYKKTGTEGILQNCALQIFFASNDESTTHYIAGRLGTKTVQTQSRSQGHNWETSTSRNHISRPLLAPEEIRRLNPNKAIIFKETTRPILADKIRYYKDGPLSARLMKAPAVPVLELPPPPLDRADAKAADLLERLPPPPTSEEPLYDAFDGEIPEERKPA